MDYKTLAEVAMADTGTIEDLERALIECIQLDSDECLVCVLALADCDYSGTTYKWYHKYPAAAAAALWGNKGLSLLADQCLKTDLFSSKSVLLKTLAYAASGRLLDMTLGLQYMPALREHLIQNTPLLLSNSFRDHAKKCLLNVTTNIEPEEPIPHILLSSIEATHGPKDDSTSHLLMSALSARWFRLNQSGIDNYKRLIDTPNLLEETVHKYLALNPHFFDPFYVRCWSKAPLGERYVVDFLIKLADDNYIVIEIEKPEDAIITKSGNLSSKCTHAIRQALEYREWLVSNHLYARNEYEHIWRPQCMVVIGMESSLSDSQRARLMQENESRQGVLKIVGFDWLYNRASAVLNNLTSEINKF